MAKRKAQNDEQEVEAVEQQEAAPEATEKSDTSEILKKVISDTNEEIRRFMPRLRASVQEHDDLAKEAKDAKKTMEGNHLHLSMLCGRLADAMNGKYQPTLFDDPAKEVPADDEAAGMPIGVLKDHGITAKMVEILIEHDVPTVGALEALMRADAWWHQKIPGFAEARIEKIVDALTSYRSMYPMPSPDDEPAKQEEAA